jgi:hypothetical protein
LGRWFLGGNQNDDEAIAKAAADVEADGKRRFGDNWPDLIGAVSKLMPAGTNPADVLRIAIRSGDAAGAFERAGHEALAELASNGDREAEMAFSKMRSKQRAAYRRSRGLTR